MCKTQQEKLQRLLDEWIKRGASYLGEKVYSYNCGDDREKLQTILLIVNETNDSWYTLTLEGLLYSVHGDFFEVIFEGSSSCTNCYTISHTCYDGCDCPYYEIVYGGDYFKQQAVVTKNPIDYLYDELKSNAPTTRT